MNVLMGDRIVGNILQYGNGFGIFLLAYQHLSFP
jgi:hypothetical protein